MERKTIPVHLPEIVWGKLATVADDRGVTVEDILTTAVMQLIAPSTAEERIIQFARAGFPDAVIADRTGQLLARVAEIRRGAGIPANRYRRSAAMNQERSIA